MYGLAWQIKGKAVTERDLRLEYEQRVEKHAQETNRLPMDIPHEEMAGLLGVSAEDLRGITVFCAYCGHVVGVNRQCDSCWPTPRG